VRWAKERRTVGGVETSVPTPPTAESFDQVFGLGGVGVGMAGVGRGGGGGAVVSGVGMPGLGGVAAGISVAGLGGTGGAASEGTVLGVGSPTTGAP